MRREIEQLRRQLETTQQQYQQAIEALTQRLQRLEVRPQVAAAAPAGQSSGPITLPSLYELARPREPFSLYAQTTPGQPGTPAAAPRGTVPLRHRGDWRLHGQPHVSARRALNVGSFPGGENRVFPREIESSFFGQIDPYARAEVRVEAGEELEDGTRSLGFGLAEAKLTCSRLPWALEPRVGAMRIRFGLLNEFHQHDRPHLDNPTSSRFFGEEGLVENGLELAWVAPLPSTSRRSSGSSTATTTSPSDGQPSGPAVTGAPADLLRARRLRSPSSSASRRSTG